LFSTVEQRALPLALFHPHRAWVVCIGGRLRDLSVLPRHFVIARHAAKEILPNAPLYYKVCVGLGQRRLFYRALTRGIARAVAINPATTSCQY
jgi:hypothetical protein